MLYNNRGTRRGRGRIYQSGNTVLMSSSQFLVLAIHGISFDNQHQQSAPTVSWCDSVWFSNTTPKYAFTAWLTMLNRLTTGDRMLLWNINIDAGYVLCNQHLETREHLFFDCSYSQEVWKGLCTQLLRSRFTYHWQEILGLLADRSQPMLQLFLLRYCFQVAIHSIWRERNNRRPGSQPVILELLIKMIDRQIRNQCLILIAKRTRRYDGVLQLWFSTR